MMRIRRREARKIAKLARALALLEDHARAPRPAPRRAGRASLSA
jgi:hypothetical protein